MSGLRRDWRPGSLVLALFLAAAAPIAGPAHGASGGPRVRAVPSAESIPAGATVIVTVKIVRARNVGSVPFSLRFDPAILELVGGSAVEGSFLRRDGTPTSFIAAPGPVSRGGGVVVGLSRLGAGGGARGKGVLCRLAFRARSPGITQLTFARASLLDPRAQPIDAVFEGTSIRVRPAP